ncbi:thioredoxin-dependent thiol peroxidase [Apibacter muscae]|uniref:thioredoxin-dependent peroxiredoxin n=1 Tax=Apibacter muscae TaxID=2509004 RepID=A0A563DI65_9FLAO|nr:thioredoxin-dependent thiol peroxidase [Apibacter muscae]TWP29827.1 thioredoxin-dependent thiol peroxidase [Apibacter muscae]TWP30975.1 thioredoxin-dependent thiol peroxidase [Apibacter muscae]
MLEIGDKVPDFVGIDQEGKQIKYSDYQGKKLVVYFYPKANTPGCTAESCSLRDNYQALQAKGYEIIGISADPVEKQKSFHEKFSFPFPLIADTDKKIIQAFGAWGKKKIMGREYDGILRYTFLIDEEGQIKDVITKVKTKEHAEQILKAI